MRSRRVLMSGLLALAALVAGRTEVRADAPPSAPALRALAGSVEAEILRTMKQKKIVGLSAVVLANGEELLVRGFGLADRSRGLEATPQTLFPVGSIAKLFTATAVMQLVEQGLVELDAPVSTYLEGFAPVSGQGETPPITVRQLLTHHSGLPSNHFQGVQPDVPDPAGYRQLPAVLGQEHLAAAPEEVFSYSNLGYALLGCIVEKATGLNYAQYLRRHSRCTRFGTSPPARCSATPPTWPCSCG